MAQIDILNSINVAGQFPLDIKAYFLSLSELKDLGTNNIKAYKYYDGLSAYCVESKTIYIWREEQKAGEEGLLPTSFVYPSNIISNGIDYSNRTFNFFSKEVVSDTGGILNTDGTYTWLVFADDIEGNGISLIRKATSNFIGMAYNKTTKTASTNPSDYIFVPLTVVPGRDGIDGANGIDGLDGSNGLIGPNGTNGLPAYFHIAYADDINGGGFSQSPYNKKFIGTYSDYTQTDSNNPIDYVWIEVSGIDGTNGIAGINGVDGETYYLHTAYSNSADGVTDFDVSNSINKTYIGILVDKVVEDSLDPSLYTWSYILNGEAAIPDNNGTFTWLKYSLTNDGSSPLVDDSDGMRFRGVALNQVSSIESDNYADYEWYLIDLTVNQDNKVRVIEVPVYSDTIISEQYIADWLNLNGLDIFEDENILFELVDKDAIILDDVILTLDPNIPLTLALSINTTNNDVVLLWDDNGDNNISRYDIIYTDLVSGELTIINLNKVNTYTLAGLTTGVKFTVHIIGYDSANNSKQSNEIPFELFAALTIPNINLVKKTDTTITLDWDIRGDFVPYYFKLFQVGVGEIYDGQAGTFDVINLTANTSYQFYVIAYTINNIPSDQSDILTVVTEVAVQPSITTPIIELVNGVYQGIYYNIAMPSVSLVNIFDYEVSYRILGLTAWSIINTNINASQLLDNLELDTTYEIKIRARSIDKTYYSNYSNIIVGTTLVDKGVAIKSTRIGTSRQYTVELYNGKPFEEVKFIFNSLVKTTSWVNTYGLILEGELRTTVGFFGLTPTHTVTLGATGKLELTMQVGYFDDNILTHPDYDTYSNPAELRNLHDGKSLKGEISLVFATNGVNPSLFKTTVEHVQ